jgi:hypothetical protein
MTMRVEVIAAALGLIACLQSGANAPPTIGQALKANGVPDLGTYPDQFLNTPLTSDQPGQRYIRAAHHINPSSQRTFLFSRDFKLVGTLEGWELLTLPDESVVFHRNQIHFAPTHALEIAVFNPSTGREISIYPPRPNQAVRAAFVARVAGVYQRRGRDWFRKNNHHMDPEQFDSALVGDLTLDPSGDAVVFTVRYGDPANAKDPLPFTQRVSVRCAPVKVVERMGCGETDIR